MSIMQHAWSNFISSYGLQYLMCVIALITAFRTAPTRRTDLEEENSDKGGGKS